jgi:hypothetical protein
MLAGIVVGGWILRDPQVLRHFWMIPLRDGFGFAVWLAGLFGRDVDWRDRRLRLLADGRICKETYQRPDHRAVGAESVIK